MEEQKNPHTVKKIVIRRSPNLLKIVLIILIVFSMAALVALRWVHNGILAQTQELRDEAADLQHQNQVLDEKIEQVDSVQGIQDIAQGELDLVNPDTVIIDPE
ncbi:MAG: hypothetical protein IKJ84_00560 [Oscillospiraceae bacterium]|nr:hypothetical protein [Oscillospiraceae bacterium]